MLLAPAAPQATTLEQFEHFANAYLVPIGLKLLVALVVFVLGRWISKLVLHGFERVMDRSKIDISLRKFLGDMLYAVLLCAVVIAALDTMGIKTTAVVAVLGAAGLAVGLALQGSLSNFAAGVMLIVLRPYKVEDLVVIGKYLGRVEAIKVFHTVLITGDYREVSIPNGQIIAAPIENLTVLGRRRVDFVVTISAAADLAKVRQLLESVVLADQRVQQSPACTIEVAEVADTGFKLYLRPWTTVDHYHPVVADTMERIRETLGTAGLKFSVSLAANT
ncbi:MAG: MscS Mechanosensitive ion channel [Myxococcales bacterium]|nr:MscS Mechanosensitive ion channel [Myxococcales bacterium]